MELLQEKNSRQLIRNKAINLNMNRIIVIGNGFDLAHGLATRYEDFINWYWNKWFYRLRGCHKRSESDGLCTFTLKSNEDTWYSFLWQQISVLNPPTGVEVVNWILENHQLFEVIQSHLLFAINKALKEKKWVDIENEYYLLLKQSIVNPDKTGITPEIVNEQLKEIQSLLTEYLLSLNVSDIKFIPDIYKYIYEPINVDEVSISGMKYFREHCTKWAGLGDREWYDLVDRYEIKSCFSSIDLQQFKEKHTCKMADGSTFIDDFSAFPKYLIRPESIMLLSFNYTLLTNMYTKMGIAYSNYIHGALSEQNRIIFGYGDELDDDYKSILKCNNNEYLKNIKSVKYLGASNYRNMLAFIESAPYQIYIMGHSCGNSDRTLLNTLFEHENCVSIKPFYYKKEEGTDNYFDIIQNINRNFTDMKLMRDRVVNKTLCVPLPQSDSESNKS